MKSAGVSMMLAVGLVVAIAAGLAGAANDEKATERIVAPLPLDRVRVSLGERKEAIFSGEDFQMVGVNGGPAVPVYVVKVMLPPEADPATVRVKLVDAQEAELPGVYDVLPMPPLVCGTNVMGAGWARKEAAYSVDAYWPDSHLGAMKTEQMSEWKYVEVEIRPLRYNPVTRKFLSLKACNLEVKCKGDPKSHVARSRSKRSALRAREVVQRSVLNFSEQRPKYDEKIRRQKQENEEREKDTHGK